MSGNSIKTTWTSDDREILRSIVKQQKEITKVQQKLLQTGRAGQQAGRKTAAGMRESNAEVSKFSKGITGIFATLGGIAGIAQALRAEFQKKKQVDEATRVASLEAGQAIREVKVNFQGDKTLSKDQLEGTIQKVAEETRSTIPIVSAVMGTAFSANSAENIVAVEAARRALQIDPTNPAQAATLAGRYLDVVSSTGSRNVAANAGFLSQVQLASRVTTPELVGQNIVPAIGSVVSQGDTPEQAAELVATLTKLIGDETGRISGTAAINLASKLGEFVPKARGKDERGSFSVPQEQRERFEQAKGPTEQISVLQQSPELRRQFLSEATFDAKARNFVKMLLSGDPKALGVQRDVQGKIDPLLGAGQEKQAKRFDDRLRFLESGELQPGLSAEQRSETSKEKRRTQDPEGTRRAEVRKIVTESMANTDLPGFDALITTPLKALFERQLVTGAVPEQAGISALQTMIDRLERFHRGDDPDTQHLREQQENLRKLQADYERLDRERNRPQQAGPHGEPQAAITPQAGGRDNLTPALQKQTDAQTQQTVAINMQTELMKRQLNVLEDIRRGGSQQIPKKVRSSGLNRKYG